MMIHQCTRDHVDILWLLAIISSSSFIWNLLIVKVRIFSAIHMWDITIEAFPIYGQDVCRINRKVLGGALLPRAATLMNLVSFCI